jgi:hypothetical protein
MSTCGRKCAAGTVSVQGFCVQGLFKRNQMAYMRNFNRTVLNTVENCPFQVRLRTALVRSYRSRDCPWERPWDPHVTPPRRAHGPKLEGFKVPSSKGTSSTVSDIYLISEMVERATFTALFFPLLEFPTVFNVS